MTLVSHERAFSSRGRISLNLEQFKPNHPLGLQRIEAQGSERGFSVLSIPAKVHYYAEVKVRRNGTSSWAVSSLVFPTILSQYSTIKEGLGRDLCTNAAHVKSLILDGFGWKYGASDLRSLSFEVSFVAISQNSFDANPLSRILSTKNYIALQVCRLSCLHCRRTLPLL